MAQAACVKAWLVAYRFVGGREVVIAVAPCARGDHMVVCGGADGQREAQLVPEPQRKPHVLKIGDEEVQRDKNQISRTARHNNVKAVGSLPRLCSPGTFCACLRGNWVWPWAWSRIPGPLSLNSAFDITPRSSTYGGVEGPRRTRRRWPIVSALAAPNPVPQL